MSKKYGFKMGGKCNREDTFEDFSSETSLELEETCFELKENDPLNQSSQEYLSQSIDALLSDDDGNKSLSQTKVGIYSLPSESNNHQTTVPQRDIFTHENSISSARNINYYDDPLANLLKSWKLFEAYIILKDKGMTIEALKVAKERHIDEMFPISKLGLKIMFEHKLFIWQKQICHSTDKLPFDVRGVLLQAEMGQRVLDEFAEAKILSPVGRTTIVHLIIQKYVESNQHISVKMCRKIAEEIVKVFPCEKVETYFAMSTKTKRVKGKLWDRYQGRKRLLRKIKPMKAQASVLETPSSENPNNFDQIEAESIRVELRYIRDWKLVVNKWKQTFPLRKIELKEMSLLEVMQRWPLYNYSLAPELVDYDFRQLCAHTFSYEKWEKLCEILPSFLENRLKDSSSKVLLNEVLTQRENLNLDNLNIYWIKLLQAAMPPAASIINGKGPILRSSKMT